jgi:hypothetical protein
MKSHLLSASMVLLLFGTPASADRLSIYSDAALTQYTIDDSVPRVVTLYVAGYLFESSGVRFSVRPGPGFTGVWLSDTSAFYLYGSSPTDIAIGFGRCVTSRSVLILTMSYQMFGTSSPCSELHAAPPNGFPYAFSTGYCGFDETPIGQLDKLYANCANPPIPPVPTEPTTWGKVKSLYRD